MEKSTQTKLLFGLGAVVILAGIIYYFKKGFQSLKSIDFLVNRVKFSKVTLTEAVIDTEVKLMNPSAIGFTIKSYEINVGINGRFVTTLKSSGLSIFIAPKSDVIIPLQIKFDPRKLSIQLGLLLLDVYTAGGITNYAQKIEISYKGRLTGEFIGLNINDIPIDYTHKVGQS
jgi:LEA14-like dessication related protein